MYDTREHRQQSCYEGHKKYKAERQKLAHHHYTYNDTAHHLPRTSPVLRSGTCQFCVFRYGQFSKSSSSLEFLALVRWQTHIGNIHRSPKSAEQHACSRWGAQSASEEAGSVQQHVDLIWARSVLKLPRRHLKCRFLFSFHLKQTEQLLEPTSCCGRAVRFRVGRSHVTVDVMSRDVMKRSRRTAKNFLQYLSLLSFSLFPAEFVYLVSFFLCPF